MRLPPHTGEPSVTSQQTPENIEINIAARIVDSAATIDGLNDAHDEGAVKVVFTAPIEGLTETPKKVQKGLKKVEELYLNKETSGEPEPLTAVSTPPIIVTGKAKQGRAITSIISPDVEYLSCEYGMVVILGAIHGCHRDGFTCVS